MLNINELHKQPEYWIDVIQNDIYRQVSDYMKENDLNKKELAKKLGISQRNVSDILKGECNLSLKKVVKLFLSVKQKNK